MITDEEGHEWARSKGLVRLDVHNELLKELEWYRSQRSLMLNLAIKTFH